MFKIKTLIIVAILNIPSIHYSQHTDQINSNRPGETMSAFAVGKSVIQVETGIYGIQENHDILNYEGNGFGLDLTLRYGFFREKLEIVADIQYQYTQYNPSLLYEDKSAFRQTVLGAKYLIYDPYKNYQEKIYIDSWKANKRIKWEKLIPAVSLFAGVNYTFEGNPYAFQNQPQYAPKVILITQNQFNRGRLVLVTNIIADYLGTDFPSYAYIITVTKGFTPKWSGFIENQGFKSDFYSDAILRGGAAYLLNKSMQIDASISSSLKNTPSILYGGIGFSCRFDGKYKEIILPGNRSKTKRVNSIK